jgi:outer membrane protein OmpA-like peptidoglycan-associated protein
MKALIWIVFTSLLITGCNKLPRSERQGRVSYNRLPEISAQGKNIAGFSRNNYLKSSEKIVKHVQNGDVQVINEGHRITLIIPTDKYFVFDTAKLNDLMHQQLADIAELIKCFKSSTIFVAGFTDDVGSDQYKKLLSQQRAQAIVAYLWSHGFSEKKVEAEGYGDKYAHANNQLVHGSALNRRIEIQWTI